MRIKVTPDYLILQPEGEAETLQLDVIEKHLREGNVKYFPDRQWNLSALGIHLSHATDK